MHISSLASNYGIGTMGDEAYKFVDFLKETHQSYWQVLPLTPTRFGNSPYQSPCIFAGNINLIDLDLLKKDGLLTDSDFAGIYFGDNEEKVDFEAIKGYKSNILALAFSRFTKTSEYMSFKAENAHWLEDYALYISLSEHFDSLPWYEWEEDIKDRKSDAISKYSDLLYDKIEFAKFTQFIFYTQWKNLKAYANKNGIEIIGDIPIYAALDSSDVWLNRHLFELSSDGTPKNIAGCPPDAYSKDGQVWGNPLYDWDEMKKEGYLWWINRIRENTKLYDVIRLDHFRGFESYFKIPYGDKTAKDGKWEKGPGMELFSAIASSVPDAKFIAEDLGFLTEDTYKLLKETTFPGTKVLQFAFDPYKDNPYLPHNYPENCVAYTGTHDCDTLVGWYQGEQNKEFIRDYLNVATDEYVPVAIVRTVLASRARIAIIPIQDYLGYGRRMNTPSPANDENWSYRLPKNALSGELSYHIKHLTSLYKRDLHI